jgi:hypothetical protein
VINEILSLKRGAIDSCSPFQFGKKYVGIPQPMENVTGGKGNIQKQFGDIYSAFNYAERDRKQNYSPGFDYKNAP